MMKLRILPRIGRVVIDMMLALSERRDARHCSRLIPISFKAGRSMSTMACSHRASTSSRLVDWFDPKISSVKVPRQSRDPLSYRFRWNYFKVARRRRPTSVQSAGSAPTIERREQTCLGMANISRSGVRRRVREDRVEPRRHLDSGSQGGDGRGGRWLHTRWPPKRAAVAARALHSANASAPRRGEVFGALHDTSQMGVSYLEIYDTVPTYLGQ